MLAFQTISLVVVLAIIPICLSHPSIRIRDTDQRDCRGCGDECSNCLYGVSRSVGCNGIPECRKGPNESCGGKDDIMGMCGDGMNCLCEKCVGCSSVTYKCSSYNLDPCRSHNDEMEGYYEPRNIFKIVQ